MIKNNSTGIVIQVRSSSTRFRNKFTKKINKLSIISFLIKRLLNYSKDINLIIAIPNKDIKIYSHIKKIKNIKIFFGKKNDVLDRYYKCALKYNLDTIVRLTGDNPLTDLRLMFDSLKKHIKLKKNLLLTVLEIHFQMGLNLKFLIKARLNICGKILL